MHRSAGIGQLPSARIAGRILLSPLVHEERIPDIGITQMGVPQRVDSVQKRLVLKVDGELIAGGDDSGDVLGEYLINPRPSLVLLANLQVLGNEEVVWRVRLEGT